MKDSMENLNYPILKALNWLYIYKIMRLILIIFTSSYFLGIIWQIFVNDVQVKKLLVPGDPSQGYEPNFFSIYMEGEPPYRILVKSWYYGITTLSTIGFGDLSPQTINERVVASFVLLFGVSMFSFVMGQFIEILMGYKSLNQVGHHKDLSKWIALLQRYNNGNPLNKELVTRIEDFFDFYWENNRMSAINLESG